VKRKKATGLTTFLLGAAVLCLPFCGCAIRQEALVEVDGSGSVRFHIEVEPFFLETMLEMAEFSGESMEEGVLFDLEKITEDFRKKPTVELVALNSPAPEILDGEFRFQDVQEVFRGEAELRESGVVTFSRSDKESSIRFYLDRDNFVQVSSFLTFLENPFFSMFSPVENEGTTQDEYLEMMEFVFGEEGPPAIRESTIQVRIEVKGKILSQSGGRVIGRSVIYEIPLLEVLLLAEPLEYSLSFR